MRHSDFTRAVAKSTGEDHRFIAQRGFSIVEESPTIDYDDIDAMVADWNMIRAEEVFAKVRWRASEPRNINAPQTNRLNSVVAKSRSSRKRHQSASL